MPKLYKINISWRNGAPALAAQVMCARHRQTEAPVRPSGRAESFNRYFGSSKLK